MLTSGDRDDGEICGEDCGRSGEGAKSLRVEFVGDLVGICSGNQPHLLSG